MKRVWRPLVLLALCFTLSSLALLGLAQGQDRPECVTPTHCVLMRSTVHESDRDEPPVARWDRLLEVSRGVEDAAEPLWFRAAVISVALHESHLARDVQHCERLGDNGRAVGLWQSHYLECPATAQEQAARAALDLRRAMNHCGGETLRDRVRRGVSLYATGAVCEWAGATKRVRTWEVILSWLWALKGK